MLNAKNLSILLALAMGASACTTEEGGDGGEGGGEGGGEEEEVPATDATGSYSLRSNFDLATNAPGRVGDVTNVIINMTDGATDPADWLLEQIANKLGGTAKSVINNARPLVAGYLNQQLLQFAPDFVDTMVQMGNDFGQMARGFGTNETLVVTGSTGAYTSTHTVLGAHFKIDNIESDHLFADHGVANIVVQSVGVSLDQTGKFGIADHMVPLTYGKVLRVGLDAAIIPILEPGATNLGQLLQAKVDCQQVGQVISTWVSENSPIPFFTIPASTAATACDAGLVAGANVIYQKIDEIDGLALEFGLAGTAKALDTNSDKKVDKIQTGTWAGQVTYGGTPAPLAGATFFGTRQ